MLVFNKKRHLSHSFCNVQRSQFINISLTTRHYANFLLRLPRKVQERFLLLTFQQRHWFCYSIQRRRFNSFVQELSYVSKFEKLDGQSQFMKRCAEDLRCGVFSKPVANKNWLQKCFQLSFLVFLRAILASLASNSRQKTSKSTLKRLTKTSNYLKIN